MKILSINEEFILKNHEIKSILEKELKFENELKSFDLIIIGGGDGTIRRVIKRLHKHGLTDKIKIVINPKGTSNVLFNFWRCKNINSILNKIEKNEELEIEEKEFYLLNKKHVFLFSAGNSFDALYMHISEFLRISILNKSKFRYFFAFIFLAPFFILWLPFFMLSKNYFFIFTLLNFKIDNFFGLYSKVKELNFTLKDSHTIVQIDGDLVFIKTNELKIRQGGFISVVVG